ncbi:uncharacterized protein LOC131883023 [Tigriopus californicus]|uniref:uncharacterized protein LOC131883023 n=1 Tax=Tigriopus californicus TaxID=6832 RepID=UPI0027DA431C|nr:uncharacterized protein LOC131883023 [Tigriopus californicus]
MNEVLTSPVPSFRPPSTPDCSSDVDTGTQTDWGGSPPRSKRSNDKSLDDCLGILQGEIWKILSDLSLEEVELKVGKTLLQQDQAVVLAWNQIQTLHPDWNQSFEPNSQGDGTLLYLAIKIKKHAGSNDENNNEPASNTCHSEPTKKSNNASPPRQPKNGRFRNAIKKTFPPKVSSKFKHESSIGVKPIDPQTIVSDWKSLVTRQRGVSSSELSGLFKEDRFRHRSKNEPSVFDEIAQDWERESCQSSQTVIEDLSASSVIAGTRKNKKSVRWKEQLEETLTPRPRSQSQSKSCQPGNAQNRPDSLRQSRRDKFESSSARPSGSKILDPGKQGNQASQRRNGSLEFPKPRKRRHEVLHKLDDTTPRSRSVEVEDPVGVLTSRVCDLESLARKNKVPEMHNMIRRRRCNHAKTPENIWFGGPSFKSFNSRCLVGRYDRHTLDEDAKQYFYFRSLPRISN